MSAPSEPAAFERAKARFLEGLRCHQQGLLDDAVGHYLASLADVPGRASTLTNLAAARLALGRPAQALADARAALAAEPQNLEALRHEATALAELGHVDDALRAFRAFVALGPAHHDHAAAAWMAIGNLLMERHQAAEATQAFEHALKAGAEPESARFHLAAARAAYAARVDDTADTADAADTAVAAAAQRSPVNAAPPTDPPAAPPRAYVESLFDRYAHDFDRHLVEDLGYAAPQRLIDALPPQPDGQPRRFTNALDLGCGTGLCAPLLRPRVQRLVGVDLSARMLDHARALALYDHLEHADIGEWLAACNERFDFVIAADVFIYVGALEAVFAGVARVLEPGGLFAFSLEAPHLAAALSQGYVLQPSKRYAHTLAYVRALSQRHDMHVVASHRGAVRREQQHTIEGTYVVVSSADASSPGR